MSSNSPHEAAIFDIARRIRDKDVREEYVSQICGTDATLHARVSALLRALDEEPDFLPTPRHELAADPTTLPVSAGDVIGHYKLREQIGEGGFGVVFVAEQEKPVARKVALKVVKPGMDTREVIARFEAERQALAMMNHPNIAKVFEAGSTKSGHPYFVMELVPGLPITEYCDRQKFTTRDRMKLFVTVCKAIQHAHQKGVIHRDLKPNNVLVTEHDGEPVVKVIDFGVAKAINQRLTEKTVYTAFRMMIGTPMYMSPEQADLSGGIDVDTRSDVYSLGVLLYELITSQPPFDQRRLREATYDELRRIIREEDPAKPSMRVSTLRDTIEPASRVSSLDFKRLSQLLRGDVDWIVMKAIEKDRTRRYATAESFAEDIERYLDDEPVEARPPSSIYRFYKLIRRNKVAVSVCPFGSRA